jgi:SAM-dependent methyltransferase
MLEAGGLNSKGIEVRAQPDGERIPFDDAQFDLVTAVCVYHHVAPRLRDRLTCEVRRVLKPGGVFAVIEHNPYNPVTQLIVSRAPVDTDAILLRPAEVRTRLRCAGFRIDAQQFFLYFPARMYGRFGPMESMFRWLPLGGQYAVFALRCPSCNTCEG